MKRLTEKIIKGCYKDLYQNNYQVKEIGLTKILEVLENA